MTRELYASGAVTLTGGGTVTLSDSVNNDLLPASGGGSLTNVNNTISGSGNIGNKHGVYQPGRRVWSTRPRRQAMP